MLERLCLPSGTPLAVGDSELVYSQRSQTANLRNFMRTLAMPKAAEPWSLTSLREKLIKIGTKVVSHGRYVTFQMAEIAVPQQMFVDILSLIARLRAPLAPA